MILNTGLNVVVVLVGGVVGGGCVDEEVEEDEEEGKLGSWVEVVVWERDSVPCRSESNP